MTNETGISHSARPHEIADEVARERAHVDAAFARVQMLRERAAWVAEQSGSRTDVTQFDEGALFQRDVAVMHAAHRRTVLSIPRDRLCIGRLDGDLAGETDCSLHIGRIAVSDESGDPLVVDWRAPAAAAFYRARPGDAMGVRRRRHFRWHGGELVGLDDEVIDARALADDELHLVGEGALLAALEAPRSATMRDIVGTIQADQDRVIRRPAKGVTIVEGGPGTGKTAVALHRAAYLLYDLLQRGDETAVLFVGPSRTFLRYVGDVVPSLGEDRVVLATAADLGPDVAVTVEDPFDSARVKGDARMVEVLDRAVAGFQCPLDEPADIGCGRYFLHLDTETTRPIVEQVQRMRGTHNHRRSEVRRLLDSTLADQYRDRADRDPRVADREDRPAPAFEDVVDDTAVQAVLDLLWPRLTPEGLLGRLYASPGRLRDAGRNTLDAAEIDSLHRPTAEGWSEGDIALLDELSSLLDGTEAADSDDHDDDAAAFATASLQLVETALNEEMQGALENRTPDCPRCQLELSFAREAGVLMLVCTNFECGGTWPAADIIGDGNAQMLGAIIEEISDRFTETAQVGWRPADRRYAHVVIDEGQDVSAMQWRAIFRRCPSHAATIAGDLHQASRPWSIAGWDPITEHAASAGVDSTVIEFTVNYRTPREVMDFAAERVRLAGGEVAPPRSVRSSGEAPRTIDGLAPGLHGLLDEARATVDEAGTVVAIVPERLAEPGRADVLTATEAKGLEFDGVVLVDPDAIAGESAIGANLLYVALTRTTGLLWVAETSGPDGEL